MVSLVATETQAGNTTVATMINALDEHVQGHMHIRVVSWFHSTLVPRATHSASNDEKTPALEVRENKIAKRESESNKGGEEQW